MEKLSEHNLCSLFWKRLGYLASQSVETRNLSILDQEGESQLLDHVKDPPYKGKIHDDALLKNEPRKLHHSWKITCLSRSITRKAGDIEITSNAA
jgi:hypothetical protein